jgi:hypothetical protein
MWEFKSAGPESCCADCIDFGRNQRYESLEQTPRRRTTAVVLPDEPEGWQRLQTMAQRERNPQRLVEIIDQMNRLLDEHERRAGGRGTPRLALAGQNQ